jgi:hypothetical protein
VLLHAEISLGFILLRIGEFACRPALLVSFVYRLSLYVSYSTRDFSYSFIDSLDGFLIFGGHIPSFKLSPSVFRYTPSLPLFMLHGRLGVHACLALYIVHLVAVLYFAS